jgi:uncharacterized integral membrane protein
MGLVYIIVGLVSAAIAIFALQNNQPLSVRFAAWSLDNVPLAGALLVALGAGLVVAALPLLASNLRLRARARRLERRVEALETAAAPAREPAHLTPRPVVPPAPTSRSA